MDVDDQYSGGSETEKSSARMSRLLYRSLLEMGAKKYRLFQLSLIGQAYEVIWAMPFCAINYKQNKQSINQSISACECFTIYAIQNINHSFICLLVFSFILFTLTECSRAHPQRRRKFYMD